MTDADGYDKINIFKYIKRLEKTLIWKSANYQMKYNCNLKHLNIRVASLTVFIRVKSYVCNVE